MVKSVKVKEWLLDDYEALGLHIVSTGVGCTALSTEDKGGSTATITNADGTGVPEELADR